MSHDRVVVRGEAAVAARLVVFGDEVPPADVSATGPWADTYNEVRAAAQDSGYREGLAQGLLAGTAEGREEVRRRADGALQALERAAQRLAAVDGATAEALSPQVVELALELTRMILGREVATASDPGRDALTRVLPLVPDRGELVVRLNPDDLGTLGRYDALVPAGRDLTLAPDYGVRRGDAVVDVGPCRIDGGIDSAWERVAAVLRGQEVAP